MGDRCCLGVSARLGAALRGTARHCTALHGTARHCTALHCTARHCLLPTFGLGRCPYGRNGSFPCGLEVRWAIVAALLRGLAVVRTAGTGPFLASVWERTTSFPCGLEARWVIVCCVIGGLAIVRTAGMGPFLAYVLVLAVVRTAGTGPFPAVGGTMGNRCCVRHDG